MSKRRILKELKELNQDPPENLSAGPKGDDIHEWSAVVVGPADSPYANGIFMFDISFPTDYPFKPPRVVARTKVYHCNFIPEVGLVYLPILWDKWSPAQGITKVLLGIVEILKNPDVETPKRPSVAHQLLTDKAKHDEMASDWTQRFAFG